MSPHEHLFFFRDVALIFVKDAQCMARIDILFRIEKQVASLKDLHVAKLLVFDEL